MIYCLDGLVFSIQALTPSLKEGDRQGMSLVAGASEPSGK